MTASCAGCDATWTGTRTEHCSAPGCHRTFSGTAAGDMHRVGRADERRCLSHEAMVRKGMRGKHNGQGTFVWTAGGENPFSLTSRGDLGAPSSPSGYSGLTLPLEAAVDEFGGDVA